MPVQLCHSSLAIYILFFVLRLVSPKLPVSLDCPFLIDPSGVSNVYLLHLGKHLIRDVYDMSSITNIENLITEQRVPLVE